MNVKYIGVYLLVATMLSISGSANEPLEAEINLNDGAAQESIMSHGKGKTKKWQWPEWLKKAAEKQAAQEKEAKKVKQAPTYDEWDDYDDQGYYY